MRLEPSTTERFGYDSRYQIAVRVDGAPATPIDLTPFAPPSTPPVGTPPPLQPLLDALLGPRLGPDTLPDADGWTYDLTGNRTRTTTAAGATTDYTVDPRDRYTDVAGATHVHDRAGNLISDGSRDYIHDGFRRLVRVNDQATGVDLVRYSYDPGGRRVVEAHAIGEPNADLIMIAHDGVDRIADYRDGTCTAQYIHGPAVDDPVELAADGTEHTYHADLQGSVRVLTTATGTVAAEYRFDPFGVLLAGTGPALGSPGVGATQPFGYAGRPFDPATGHYDFRARIYLPALGRFLQGDPAGPVDGHLYAFAGNHPLAFGDPSGLARGARFEYHGGSFATLEQETVAVPSASNSGRMLPLRSSGGDGEIGVFDAQARKDYADNALRLDAATLDNATLLVRTLQLIGPGGKKFDIPSGDVDFSCAPCRTPAAFEEQDGVLFAVDANHKRIFDGTVTPRIASATLSILELAEQRNSIRLRLAKLTFLSQINIASLAAAFNAGWRQLQIPINDNYISPSRSLVE